MNTTHALDDLVEAALPTAMRLAITVHDRDQASTHDVLTALRQAGDWDRACALMVALAAMVPDDRPAADLLLWSHGPVVSTETYEAITRITPEGMKRCSRCRELLALDAFNKDSTMPDGHKPRCRTCIAEIRLERTGQKGAA